MPPSTKWITILRHPLKTWESAYHYFRFPKRFGWTLNDLLQDEEAIGQMRRRKLSFWFGFNMAFYDLGFVEDVGCPAYEIETLTGIIRCIGGIFGCGDDGIECCRKRGDLQPSASSKSQAEDAIKLMEDNFDFVMIAEFMEESLVMLKDQFCWDLENVVAFRYDAKEHTLAEELTGRLHPINFGTNFQSNYSLSLSY